MFTTPLIDGLPNVRGTYRANASLDTTTWFRVGGPAEVLYRPADSEDLACFLAHKSCAIDYTTIGVGSNLLVRDGGVPGVVVRLGRGFTNIALHGNSIDVGAGVLDSTLAKIAGEEGFAGLEFLCGIPGTIGGALRMNAGCYGSEIKDILEVAIVLDPQGKTHFLTPEDLGLTYRHSNLPKGWIFVGARFRITPADPAKVQGRIQEMLSSREASQPIRERTGGSTFANPEGHKAWELIDKAGCRGLTIGGAQVSEKHCNFLINQGSASAYDLEQLGETVRSRVQATCGINLQWEIQRIGQCPTHELKKVA
jgi:UDP-N-acetylmuramate dehydrogenase (EC 1.1.1.158)